MSRQTKYLTEYGLYFPRPLKGNSKLIEERSRCILSNLATFLKRRVRIDGIWKVNLFANSSNPKQHGTKSLGSYSFNIEFDTSSFLKMGIESQKEYLLDLLLSSIMSVFKDLNLPAELLEGAKSFIVERNYINVFSGPKTKFHNKTAQVICEQGFEKAELFAEIKVGRVVSDKIKFKSTSPEEFIFNIYCEPLDWISETTLQLKTAKGDLFKFNI